MAWTKPKTWLPGTVPTAADLNAQVRDNLNVIAAAWTSYSPSWKAGGTNPSIGNGTISAAYSRVGRIVTFRILLTTGSSTTYGTGTWSFSLPAASVEEGPIFVALARDVSAGRSYPCVGEVDPGTPSQIGCYTWPTTAGSRFISTAVTQPFAWATGDYFFVSGSYEAEES